MAITQTVETKTPNGINMLVHKCECGESYQFFQTFCKNCGREYWRHYARLY